MPPVERRQALISDRKEIGRIVRPPTTRCANAREPVIENDAGAFDGAPLPLGEAEKKAEDWRRPRRDKQQGRRSFAHVTSSSLANVIPGRTAFALRT
jgi:hypothetical protein